MLLRIVADQPQREIVARLEQQLAAQQPAVAIIDPAARIDVLEEAVALDINAVQARRDGVASGPVMLASTRRMSKLPMSSWPLTSGVKRGLR